MMVVLLPVAGAGEGNHWNLSLTDFCLSLLAASPLLILLPILKTDENVFSANLSSQGKHGDL